MPEASARGRIARAALLLTVATITSRILGYMRDAMLYAQFGQNRYTDIYQAAFSVPDFFYSILVGGAFSSAFIPVFGGYLATDQEEEGWYAANSLFNLIFLLLVGLISFGMLYTPQFVRLLVPGFDAGAIALTAHLTRIMFFQTLLLGVAGIVIGMLNSYKKFNSFALGNLLYNVPVLVVGVYLFRHPALLDNPGRAIAYYSFGVVAGALVNLLVQLPSLRRTGFRFRPVLDLRHPGVRQFGRLVFPVLISQSVLYFNTFVSQNLASGLPGGELAALKLAQRIMQIPLGLFALAIGTAIFPTMTEQAARGRWDDLRRSISLGLKTTNFLTIPAAVGLIALGLPLTRLFFQFGKFTTENTATTSAALFYFAFGIIGYSAAIVLARAFYAIKDTITPVAITVGTVLLAIALSLLLVGPMGIGGLALAYSAAGIIQMLAMLAIIRIRLGHVDGMSILASGAGSAGASLVMGLACYFTVTKLQALLGVASKLSQFTAVGGSVVAGILVYLLVAYLLRMEEVRLALEMAGRRFNSRRARAAH